MLIWSVALVLSASAGLSDFWAVRPMTETTPPDVREWAWCRTDVDRFILKKLEEKGLHPSQPADKTTWLRRVSFDLTGLPPSEREVRAFLADEAPDAFDRVIDRLLALPRYGERWGRHWLDVARYAESTGSDEDYRYPNAWRYRDYVIAAFNQDLRYDQFVREQVAGDLLPPPPGEKINRRGVIATGFLALGPKALAQQDRTKMLYDVYDEQLDTTTRAFLGLTVACARCHDHKFDPISTRDYYGMVSIFASTRSFKETATPVATLHRSALGAPSFVERFERHRLSTSYVKAEIDSAADEETARFQERLAERLADFMTAARAVYEDGRAVDAVAREKRLSKGRLSRWVDYLKSRDPLRLQLKEWDLAPPNEIRNVAERYQEAYTRGLASWQEKLASRTREIRERATAGRVPPPPRPEILAGDDRFFYDVTIRDSGPFFLSEKEREKAFSPAVRERLGALQTTLRALEEGAPPAPDFADAVAEGESVEQKIFFRGDHRRPGPGVPKGVPKVLGDGLLPVTDGTSGRLELAEWLTRPDQPLTARVMVNRIWQYHFGEGLVRTGNNWGRSGEPPTHPELLDYLAARFVESGWSVKAMHRLILHSSVYRLGSRSAPAAGEIDPENRLLSHFSRRRLDVEEIRDALLAVDDSLDLTMGGTLDPAEGSDVENSPARLSFSPEKSRRRTIYLPVRRANLPWLLNIFDFGDAVNSHDRRSTTTVAPQALFLMNSAWVAERARELSRRLLAEKTATDGRRVETSYYRILGRPPSAEEFDQAYRYLDGFTREHGDRAKAWESFCRVLLQTNEFIHVD